MRQFADAVPMAGTEAWGAYAMVNRLPGSSPGPNTVVLRQRRGADIELALPQNFESEAMRWSYIARSRERWRSGSDDPAQGSGNPLVGILNAKQIDRLADDPVLEVHIPSHPQQEAFGWAARVFPWEYTLAALTREHRREPMTVLRVLSTQRTEPAQVNLSRPGVVQSAPSGLERWYDVRGEGELMFTCMGQAQSTALRLENPGRAALTRWLAAERPTLLHMAGVDNHQANALLRLRRPDEELRDGMVLAPQGAPTGEAPGPDLVPAEDLAQLLTAGPHKPDLVVFNAYNTASRVAARTVARGVRFSIGYHDTINDSMAATFCATLYSTLRANGGDMLPAFQAALEQVRGQPELLRGACIVLWSAVSLLRSVAAPARGGTGGSGLPQARAQTDLVPGELPLRVVCDPLPRVNYSLLHNKKSLFRSLQLYRNNVAGEIREIEVRVTLNTGDASVPFVTAFNLEAEQTVLELASKVVVPLTSALIRRQSERVQSSVTVEVLCAGRRCFLETHRVGLCPVDEWQDGEVEEWGWLPSFVLPRDPAVPLIIDSAQTLLATLADDPGAGFDGYQSIDTSTDDPDWRYAAVDRQVQAIWHAIVHRYPLSYINPPPSYGSVTQRIRTPSQIMGEKRGTCIDLALLLASCLEYVDIYPVLFLLTGHCFVGYWRGDDLHEAFRSVSDIEAGFSDEAIAPQSSAAGVVQVGHVLDQGQHLEVRQLANERRVVPLEATWLCQRGGFASAAEEGRKNLRSKRDFCAMVDVKLARDRDVTPLPLLGEGA